jgi:uncharacterized protein
MKKTIKNVVLFIAIVTHVFSIQSHADMNINLFGKDAPKSMTEVLKSVQKAAEQGIPEGQLMLGGLYEKGEYGLPKDVDQAIEWYKKAAEQNNSEAQFKLGYLNNSFKEYVEAIKWYTLAAENGYSQAQYELGMLWYNGHGVTQDYTKAAQWFNTAAGQNYNDAHYMLGLMYADGLGVPRNPDEAIRLLTIATKNLDEEVKNSAKATIKSIQEKIAREKQESDTLKQTNSFSNPLQDGISAYNKSDYAAAFRLFAPLAEHGDLEAQNYLGLLYDKGQGVQQDTKKAAYWYNKAADQGYAMAQNNLGSLYFNDRSCGFDIACVY